MPVCSFVALFHGVCALCVVHVYATVPAFSATSQVLCVLYVEVCVFVCVGGGEVHQSATCSQSCVPALTP